MGLKKIDKRAKTIKKSLQRARDKKAGVPVKHLDFLNEPVTPETARKYRAAIAMGDTEHKLATEGLPKPKNYLEKIRKKLRKPRGPSLIPVKHGGKVYKVDNSGQHLVAKQYGGKVN